MNLPYALQLAHGWTSLTFYTNMVSVIILIPLEILAISYSGAIGAAMVWVILNGSYVIISIPIMHRRLLKGEQKRWYLEDVGGPLITALGVIGIGRLLIQDSMPLPIMLGSIAIMLALALASVALAASQIRTFVFEKIRQWIPVYDA